MAPRWHQLFYCLPSATEQRTIPTAKCATSLQVKSRIKTNEIMLKITLRLFFAFTLFTIATARPGYLHGHHGHHFDYPLIHHHPEPLHIAKIVHVPAAVSHQSSTVIHSAPIIKPIVVPVIKTYHAAPIIKAYHPAPLHIDPYHHHHFDHHDFHHYH